MNKNKFYTTTPIYYVNDVPHIGHTYTTVAADVITRYWKQKGYDARLLTGTDEHGAKIVEAAKKHAENPKEYVDKISGAFKKAWKDLDIEFTRFIRTTDEDHIKVAQYFLQELYDKGAIEPKPRLYTGLYCVGHEQFMSPEELINGLCPDHQIKPIEHSEENYYFRLSDYEKQIKKLIETDEIKISPEKRKNEILGKLRQGLEDISISRANLEWGVPLPFDKTHTSYVWIEALVNYYTYGSQNKFWPVDLHLVGKDILWFHAIIWPAMLLAIGESLPKKIFAHGFFTIDGQKMSKTIGNVIHPNDLISKYGIDGTRYVILSSFSFGEDGNFSWELFDKTYNADLANGLGNLVARLTKLIELNNVLNISEQPQDFSEHVNSTIVNLQFDEALKAIGMHIRNLDKLLNEWEPWKKSGIQEAIEWTELIQGVRQVAYDLQPFLPETSEKILKQFSGQIKSAPGLFPRI
jgi:methionyl-tRNA synthetase